MAKTTQPLITENSTVKITLPWSEVKPIFNKEVAQHAKQLKVPGFRKGKVPAHIAKSQLNLEHVIGHTIEHITPPAFQKIVEKQKLNLIVTPEVRPLSTEEGKDWEVEVHYAERPVVTVDNYKSIAKKALQSAKKLIAEAEKSRADQLKKAAIEKSEKKSSLKKDAPKPELTADEQDNVRLQEIFRALVEEIKPAMPELLVRHETNQRIESFLRQLQQVNLDLKDYLARRQQGTEQFLAEKQAESLGALQLEFILQTIGTTAKIEVGADALTAALADIKDEKLRAQAENDQEYRNYLKHRLGREAISKHLLAVA